jgi:hypothetical protein
MLIILASVLFIIIIVSAYFYMYFDLKKQKEFVNFVSNLGVNIDISYPCTGGSVCVDTKTEKIFIGNKNSYRVINFSDISNFTKFCSGNIYYLDILISDSDAKKISMKFPYSAMQRNVYDLFCGIKNGC